MNDLQRDGNEKIGVVGAGSWGTALAILFANNLVDTLLWGNEATVTNTMLAQRENSKYLPGLKLPKHLTPVHELQQLQSCSTLLVAVPSHAFRQVLGDIKQQLPNVNELVWATKGFELSTRKLLHEVASEVFGDSVQFAVLSGPTFALEVARGLPTAVTIASENEAFANKLAHWLHNVRFRAYTSQDMVGVQVGGASKNVLAIAAGIADGLGFGANTRAALITRGLAEIMRLGETMGAQHDTLMGLSGMGDLVLTCTDNLSRNRRFGLALAKGLTQEEAKAEIGQVVEGIEAADAVHALAQTLSIEMPICEQVYNVLYRGANPEEAVKRLFLREIKSEFED